MEVADLYKANYTYINATKETDKLIPFNLQSTNNQLHNAAKLNEYASRRASVANALIHMHYWVAQQVQWHALYNDEIKVLRY